jgi:hypothetical protein
MVTTTADKQVLELCATLEEVQTLRTIVETFMMEQDIQNKTISSSLEKLLELAEDSGAKFQDSSPEDKGSGVKGKDTSQNYKIPQLRSTKNYKGILKFKRRSILFQALVVQPTNNLHSSTVSTSPPHKMATMRRMNTLNLMMVMSILSSHGISLSKRLCFLNRHIPHHPNSNNLINHPSHLHTLPKTHSAIRVYQYTQFSTTPNKLSSSLQRKHYVNN